MALRALLSDEYAVSTRADIEGARHDGLKDMVRKCDKMNDEGFVGSNPTVS